MSDKKDTSLLLLHNDLETFCNHVFSKKYSEIKSIIYPQPRYRTFFIQKKSGGLRAISEPRLAVKELQIKLLSFLSSFPILPKHVAHAFISKRSIVTNARTHLANAPHYLLNIDLQDFFPTIDFYRIRGLFNSKMFGFSYEISTVLSQLCTYKQKLPQGAVTSPFLSNLICRRLDSDLTKLARQHRALYTRYADDITFSFRHRKSESLPKNICSYDTGVLSLGDELVKTIEVNNNFKINHQKTRISHKNHRLEVTGIKINEFTNVDRNYIDSIRGALHAWEKYGYSDAETEWRKKTSKKLKTLSSQQASVRQTRKSTPPQLCNYLWGKLLFLKMVKGSNDLIYNRLAVKFNKLVENNELNTAKLPVYPIVQTSADAEDALFVVEWSADFTPTNSKDSHAIGCTGTAFAYTKTDLLITCDHVLHNDADMTNTHIQSPGVKIFKFMAIHPKTRNEFKLEVIARNRDLDLAVLRIVNNQATKFFAPATSDPKRHQKGIQLGFPNWARYQQAHHDQAEIQNIYNKHATQRIEISSTIRRGFSGGPFVDKDYRVLGIAQEGATQKDGSNLCMSIKEVLKFDQEIFK